MIFGYNTMLFLGIGSKLCIIDSKQGAKASAMYYSIAETAKANGLKLYEYFKYVLDQMLLYLNDKPADYISDLLPWSDSCKKHKR